MSVAEDTSVDADTTSDTAPEPIPFVRKIDILDLEKSHRLINIYIDNILNRRSVDLTKLQYVKDFTNTIDTEDPNDVLSNLLYYQFYQHGQYVDEKVIADLLKTVYMCDKKPSKIMPVLVVCFSRAINNYIHAHLLQLANADVPASESKHPIPERSGELIAKYGKALIGQYVKVFQRPPQITLNEQYTKLKTLEAIDIAMYQCIIKDGFNDNAEALFMKSWGIFSQIYTTPEDPNHIIGVKKELSTLTHEQCTTMIEQLNPDKYNIMLGILRDILGETAAVAVSPT